MKFASAALAAVAVASFVATAPAHAADDKKADTVKCEGINSCKGTSECKTAKSACKGQNACKGTGVVSASAKDCKDKKGTVAK